MAEKVVPGVRTFATFTAVGGVALLAIAAVNLVADHTRIPGLVTLRDYLFRAHG